MSTPTTSGGYEIVDFAALTAVPCPCGMSRRAFVDVEEFPATIHRVEITGDARRHYHRRLTEVYYILDCDQDAALELDDARVAAKPGLCVLIRPGVRHRAVGRMNVLNIVLPKFDPDDEWFD